MYVVYIIDYIHYLLNEPKKWIFAYNCDRRVYTIDVQNSQKLKFTCNFFLKSHPRR